MHNQYATLKKVVFKFKKWSALRKLNRHVFFFLVILFNKHVSSCFLNNFFAKNMHFCIKIFNMHIEI